MKPVYETVVHASHLGMAQLVVAFHKFMGRDTRLRRICYHGHPADMAGQHRNRHLGCYWWDAASNLPTPTILEEVS